MTVVRDTFLESATFTTTTPHTFTFTPVGTPRAILVAVAWPSVTDEINGAVTYGGVAMARIALATTTAGDEDGSAVLYFLGAGIPTGAQTVSITHTGATTVKWAACQSMTAGADTEVTVSGTVATNTANPSVALDTGATSSLRTAILYSGTNQPGNAAVLTGMEANTSAMSHDFGNFTAFLGMQTTAATGSFTIGWTVALDDAALVAAAVQEVSGVQPLTGSLFTKAPAFPTGAVSQISAQNLDGVLFTNVPTFPTGSFTRPFPIRQQISHFLTGTSISGVLRVAPIEDAMVFAVFSAETTLANMTGPAGYTKAVEEQGDGVSIQIWYKRAGAAESATVTATSSASVPLRIHVVECPESLFVAGDPLDVVASNDSSTSAVTTLATGTTATVGQADTLAIAAVGTLGGNLDFLLVNWSDDYTALADHETRGLMVGFKIMTSATAAAATATWNQASAPISHKAAAAIATLALAGPVILPEPYPRRVSAGRFGGEINTTGTTDTVATFPVVTNHLYLAFVATSKDGVGNDGDAVIPDSHGGALDWVLERTKFIGTARRIHVFRAMSTSDLSAASISVTTPEAGCSVWWEVLDITGALVSEVSGEGALAQVADGSTGGAAFVETSFAVAPHAGNAVVGFCLHGQPERQLVDLDPDVHLLLGEANVYDTGGQRATVDWYDGSDQTFRWDWTTSIHALSIIVEVQADTEIGGGGYPQTVAPTVTLFEANTTEHLVTMPPVVDAGDLLLLLSAFDGGSITNPTDWTSQENELINSHSRLVTAKVADGSEGGTTVDVVTSVAERGAAQVYRITGWWGILADGLAISSRNGAGGVVSNDVPSLAPSSWDVEYTLWLAVLTVSTGSPSPNVSTYPTNYGNGVESDSGGGTAGALVASARREFAGAFDDPDSFILDVVPAGSATRLLAIRPAAAVAGVSQTPNATVSNVGWDTAPLAGQAIHTYIATDDNNYITVTVP